MLNWGRDIRVFIKLVINVIFNQLLVIEKYNNRQARFKDNTFSYLISHTIYFANEETSLERFSNLRKIIGQGSARAWLH